MRFARSSSIHLFTRFVCILEKLGSLQASGLFGPASFSAASDERGEVLEQKSSTRHMWSLHSLAPRVLPHLPAISVASVRAGLRAGRHHPAIRSMTTGAERLLFRRSHSGAWSTGSRSALESKVRLGRPEELYPSHGPNASSQSLLSF
jgi:hypothetical protein